MAKITKEIIAELISNNQLKFKSTHKRLCLSIITRLFKKMSIGIKFPGIKVTNNLICDGHHRYIASILARFPLEVIPGTETAATIGVQWQSVIFEEEDWDTAAKINMMNEQDADYNNIPMAQILELLK